MERSRAERMDGMTESWIDVDGIRTFYLESRPAGKETGKPTLLFIHGYLVRSTCFKFLTDALAGEYRILAPDLPGCGRSGDLPDGAPSFGRFASFIARFCALTGLDRPVVIGHSMGGGATIAAASTHPELFRAAVLIDSISYGVSQPLKVKLVRLPGLGKLIFKKLYGWSMFLDYFTNDVYLDASKIDMEALRDCYAMFDPPARRESSYRLMDIVLHPEELGELILRIKVPVRVLWGDSDRLVPLSCGERLAREIPGARMDIIPRAGHACFDENPQAVLAAIRSFLGSLA